MKQLLTIDKSIMIKDHVLLFDLIDIIYSLEQTGTNIRGKSLSETATQVLEN